MRPAIELKWEEQKADFEPDGSLRDIYVVGTTAEDWTKVLDFLTSGPYPAELERDGAPATMPADVRELFGYDEDRPRPCLVVHVGEVALMTHFFTLDEIELDFIPNGVGEAELRRLLELMADLGDLTGKVVVMTPENRQEAPLFRYDPEAARMTWIPPG